MDKAMERLAKILDSMGAEKLPGRLRAGPTRADIRLALAFVRIELDEIEQEAEPFLSSR